MPRPRFRIRALGYLLLGLILLFLLLEMNRWLPGGWPGGGGGGFRPVPGGGQDPARVRTPEPEETEAPPGSVRVTIRGPEGTTASGWRFSSGEGAGAPPRESDTFVLEASEARQGFRLTSGSDVVRHGPPRIESASWTVHVPPVGPGTPVARPSVVAVTVVAAETGAPIDDASASLLDAAGVRVPLRPVGEGRYEGTGTGVAVEVTAPGRATTRRALDEGATRIEVPAGRAVEVQVTDEARAPIAGAVVTARYPAATGGTVARLEPGDVATVVRTDAEGRATVRVPEGSPARVLVEAPGRAPTLRSAAPADAGAPHEVVLEKGLSLPVRVTDAGGTPLRGARVVVEASVEGLRVAGRAETGADGTASVAGLPAGPVEVYASAPGFAWAAVTSEVRSASGTVEVRLSPGKPLRLVVESPDGKPLEGVVVEVAAEGGGGEAPDVAPSTEPPPTTDASGVLELSALPDRPYRVRLSLPGRAPVTLHDVRPGDAVHFVTL